MIHVAYKIKPSATHGVGLFTDQDIKAGDIICSPSPLLDVNISIDQFNSLSSSEQREVKYYGYLHKKSNKWHVNFDLRMLNHAPQDIANVIENEDFILTAKRDIVAGEELLQDYLDFDTPDELAQRF